jgi:hypothetical protein
MVCHGSMTVESATNAQEAGEYSDKDDDEPSAEFDLSPQPVPYLEYGIDSK